MMMTDSGWMYEYIAVYVWRHKCNSLKHMATICTSYFTVQKSASPQVIVLFLFYFNEQ
jgi:hypothetical protein